MKAAAKQIKQLDPSPRSCSVVCLLKLAIEFTFTLMKKNLIPII